MTNTIQKRALLILGPHRSGTSALTRGLSCTGWCLGKTLIPPNQDNPRGFFENAQVIGFNDSLLSRSGMCWDCLDPTMPERFASMDCGYARESARDLLNSEFCDARNIILKDPRFCILAPFWHNVLCDAGYKLDFVLATRHPVEAAKSQMTRFKAAPEEHFVGSSLTEGLHLWAIYLKGALNFLAKHGGILVDFADLIVEPRKVLSLVEKRLEISISPNALENYVDNFLSHELQHHKQNPEESGGVDAIQTYLTIYRSMRDFPSGSYIDPATAQDLYHRIDTTLKCDPTVYQNLAHAYTKARITALKGLATVIDLKEELGRARNIIQYNEYLIRTLREERGEAKNGKSEIG